MSAPLRLGFVVNFEPTDPSGQWLGSFLPASQFASEIVPACPAPGSFLERHHWLPPYLGELVHLSRHRRKLAGFDVLFTWELRTTLATILLRKIDPACSARVVSLNPTIKGWTLRALPLVRLVMRGVACVVSFSRAECEAQARQFHLAPGRMRYVPRFAEARDGDVMPSDGEEFALALGHSNRDFRTLWKALADTPVRVTMYRNPWMQRHRLPNITAIPSMLSSADENLLVERAAFHVLPLKDAAFSSGLTVLLRAMASGRAVIVSNTTGIADYVRDGETALLVPPGDATALRAAMLRLWENPGERERIGRNAARAVRDEFDAPRVALRLGAIAQELARADGAVPEIACVS